MYEVSYFCQRVNKLEDTESYNSIFDIIVFIFASTSTKKNKY